MLDVVGLCATCSWNAPIYTQAGSKRVWTTIITSLASWSAGQPPAPAYFRDISVSNWIFVYVSTADIQPSAVGRLSIVKLASGKMVIRFLKQGINVRMFDLAPITGPSLNNFDVAAASPVLFIGPVHGP